jgi:sulfoxide reductase heme-binding subunit YedZ
VPCFAPYRPLWVGIGVIAFYMILLVSITFYLKSRISRSTFRSIHMISYLAFVMSALHGLMAGTDSPLLATRLMYGLTTMVVAFLTAYHIFAALPLARQAAKSK